jgi:hypothetical protein
MIFIRLFDRSGKKYQVLYSFICTNFKPALDQGVARRQVWHIPVSLLKGKLLMIGQIMQLFGETGASACSTGIVCTVLFITLGISPKTIS